MEIQMLGTNKATTAVMGCIQNLVILMMACLKKPRRLLTQKNFQKCDDLKPSEILEDQLDVNGKNINYSIGPTGRGANTASEEER